MTIQLNGTTGITLSATPALTDNGLSGVNSSFVQNLTAQYGPMGGFRNMVINGDMRIAQRATSGAMTNTIAYPSIDRWSVYQTTTANGIFAQVASSGLTGFQYAMKMGRNSGATTTGIIYTQQAFDTANSVPLQGQTVTLSFYAKAGANFSAASSAMNAQLNAATGTDQTGSSGGWTGTTPAILQSTTLTTSWQRFSYTATIGSTITQLAIIFSYTPVGTAGADDNIYVTGVQLERGPVATPFELRSQQTEVALCQRYYQVYTVAMFRENTSSTWGGGKTYVPYPVPMRANPTGGLTFTAGTINNPSYSFGATSSLLWYAAAGTAGDWSTYTMTLSAEL